MPIRGSSAAAAMSDSAEALSDQGGSKPEAEAGDRMSRPPVPHPPLSDTRPSAAEIVAALVISVPGVAIATLVARWPLQPA
jgi:hypothetical protein